MSTSLSSGRPPLSLRHNLLYSAGELAPNALVLIVSPYLLLLYRGNAEAGFGALVGAGLFAAVTIGGRLIDAISDPLVGYWSDRTRSRWGRRKPFLAFSLIPLVVCFTLIWTPPAPGLHPLNGVWLFLMLSGFFLAFTGYYGPYLALLPELTPTAAERNSVSTWQAVFKVLGMIVGYGLFGILYDRLGRPPTEARVPAEAFLRPALVIAGASLLVLPLPLFGPRERVATEGVSGSLLENLQQTLASRPFRHFVAAFFMSWFGIQILMALMPQLPVARLGASEANTGAYSTALMVAAIGGGALSFPLVKLAMARFGRPPTFLASMIWFAAIVPCLGLVHSLTAAVTVLLLAGPAVGGFLILPHALMADVCDHDQRLRGERREAIFFGVQGLIVKGAVALALPAADLLLTQFGNSSSRPFGVLACFAVASLAPLLGLSCFWGFSSAMGKEA